MSHVYFVFCAASFVIPAGRTTAELVCSLFKIHCKRYAPPLVNGGRRLGIDTIHNPPLNGKRCTEGWQDRSSFHDIDVTKTQMFQN